jgi:hypothetical protein
MFVFLSHGHHEAMLPHDGGSMSSVLHIVDFQNSFLLLFFSISTASAFHVSYLLF